MMKLLYFLFILFRFAPSVEAEFISPNIPAFSPEGGILGQISNFYQFGLLVGGLLAFGAIVFGAVKWTTSAGNPAQISDAKQWIRQALLGLLLLAGAALILRTLNPGFFGEGSTRILLPELPTLF